MKGYEDIKNLQGKVYAILEQYPDTRNSDTKLTNVIWLTYYRKFVREIDGQGYVMITDLYKLPTQDAVKRLRAVIQNDKKLFPPTSLEVAKKRKWLEEDWRKACGYNPEFRTI